jgi:hypothetical protein
VIPVAGVPNQARSGNSRRNDGGGPRGGCGSARSLFDLRNRAPGASWRHARAVTATAVDRSASHDQLCPSSRGARAHLPHGGRRSTAQRGDENDVVCAPPASAAGCGSRATGCAGATARETAKGLPEVLCCAVRLITAATQNPPLQHSGVGPARNRNRSWPCPRYCRGQTQDLFGVASEAGHRGRTGSRQLRGPEPYADPRKRPALRSPRPATCPVVAKVRPGHTVVAAWSRHRDQPSIPRPASVIERKAPAR